MRKFTWLVLACLIFLCGCGTLTDSELASEISEIIENSDVQLVTENYHHLQEVNIEYANGDTSQMKYSYPSEANAFLKNYIACTYYENGQEVRKEEYIRDRQDNIISVVTESSKTTFELTYDDHNRIIKKVILIDNIEHGHEEYLFNEQGLVTEIAMYEGDILVQRTVTEFDESGRRTKITRYDGSGSISGYDICEFDQKKYKEIISRYNADGSLMGYLLNFYDGYLLILVEEAYDADGTLISTTHRKYETGQITYDAAKGFPGKS